MRNDQACDTLGSDYEDIKVDPDIVMDQFSSDCPGIQNNKEGTEQITSEFGKLLPIDQEENASILFERERERKRTVTSVSEGKIRLRAPNWSDQQSACLKDLIMTLDGGSIYTTLLSYNKTKNGKERKMRAWDRVYREFTKIPGNKVFKLKHLFCKFKNFKKELVEEGGFQAVQAVQAVQAAQAVHADGSPHYPSNGLDWMGSDQGCDTLGSDDIEEDVKVVPEIVLDQFSPDCSEIKNEEELLDQSVSDQEENASILLDGETCGKRLINSKSKGGKPLRAPNWSDQQLACLQGLIKTLDGGNIYTTILFDDFTNAGNHKKKRAWYRVHEEFTKVPGNEMFEVEHLISKFKNYRNSTKEISDKKRYLSAQAGVPTNSLPSGVELEEPPQFSKEQSRLFIEIVESVNKKDIIDSPINTAAMKKKKIEVWRNIHAQFEERSGCNLFSIQNLIGEYRNLLFYRKEKSEESRITIAQSGVTPPLCIVNLQPLNMDTGSMGSMVGLGVTPPQFTQEQSRLFLEIVESVNKKEIIDSPVNTAAMKKKKIEVWRNIHSQFEERSGSNLFSIQNLIGKYRTVLFKHKQGGIIDLNTYYRPILPKLPEEDPQEFLDVPVKVEIHDGDEECNPLDAPVKDEEDPLKIFDNPVKGEINDEEDPLQIP
ncbi:uncharacterized protein LOC111697242 isoform X2 [Eurytemora carolleeae]|uniref:uncharacterized protein LOC111697242 isoform X2 n=1 Tax=Eurytemora carolleeae TaxID=1294199 RepID=UPI000C7601D0|nr:uncharacterized protein LOC111697242 isoform X2 [Eurytemora carolleeae]|eukprot:XP_023322932.1 uncharacterized protein LOC111697242 isoform X2 [Eurytemora affinis]